MKVNAKYVVFSAIAMASLYVLYHNEHFVVQPSACKVTRVAEAECA
jgi:hypothetical protein